MKSRNGNGWGRYIFLTKKSRVVNLYMKVIMEFCGISLYYYYTNRNMYKNCHCHDSVLK